MSILLTIATLCTDPPDLQSFCSNHLFIFSCRLLVICALIGMTAKFVDVYLLQQLPFHFWSYQSLYSGICNNANNQIRSNDNE